MRRAVSNGVGLVDPERIVAAAAGIDAVFLNSPVIGNVELDRVLGAHVVAKIETENPIKCFKGRGTDHYLRGLPSTTRRLVAASAGNFGQALAYCARGRDLAVTIFAAQNANPAKLEAIRRLGAQVRVAGRDFDDAKTAARDYAERAGVPFAEDSAEASFAEGAGTIAMELSTQAPSMDFVLVPLGNGALAGGVGAWMRHASPSTKVIGVGADRAPAMKLSFEQRAPVQTATAHTIADGIATRIPVQFGLASCLQTLTDVVSVSDESIVAGMRQLHRRLDLGVEPSAAVGVAALMADHRFAGARVAIIICGANLTSEQRQEWL